MAIVTSRDLNSARTDWLRGHHPSKAIRSAPEVLRIEARCPPRPYERPPPDTSRPLYAAVANAPYVGEMTETISPRPRTQSGNRDVDGANASTQATLLFERSHEALHGELAYRLAHLLAHLR